MTSRDQALPGRTEARADTLALRFAGGMGLTAAAIVFTCLAVVVSLPAVQSDPGRTAAYAIPGTPRMIDAAVVPVLTGCGSVAAVLGVVCLTLSWIAARRVGQVGASPTRPMLRRSHRRPVVILLCGAAALGAVLLLKS